MSSSNILWHYTNEYVKCGYGIPANKLQKQFCQLITAKLVILPACGRERENTLGVADESGRLAGLHVAKSRPVQLCDEFGIAIQHGPSLPRECRDFLMSMTFEKTALKA